MNGTDTFLDINNAHLRVNSGNVQASTFVLDQINIVTSANTATTVNFNNVTKAFNAVSNIEVGTANLFVDTTTSKVGIGTDAPEYALDVHGSANVGALTATTFSGSGAGLNSIPSSAISGTLSQWIDINTNDIHYSAGNVGIGKTPDSGKKLDVDGTVKATTFEGEGSALTALNAANIASGTLDAARVPDLDAAKITTGTLDAARVPTPTTFTTATFSGDVTVDTPTFHVDTTNNRVGIGTNSPNEPLDIYGAGIRIHHLGAEPKIDFLRGGTNRTPSGALNTFGAANYTDWRIGASGANLKFQQQYIGANSGNIIDVMTMNYNSGNVEIPGYLKTGNPAFYAHKTGAGPADESYITYNASLANIGNHMNVTAGTFTCPVAGIYTFTWGAIAASSNHVYRYYIRKNNSNIGDIHLRLDNTASGSEFGDGERTVMLSLAANDTIRIHYQDSNGSDADYGYNYTYLQGHLISYT